MRLDAITLEHFRNYAHQSVTFDPSVNVIVGENAQGKTNLLEAIVYLSSARSPRARAEKELISFGKSECSIKANAFARNRDFLLEIALAAGRRRKILINKVPVKKGSDLSDVLGAVYFCPEDLLLIRDGAAARRKFMDDALCQLRARYAQALSDYHRAYEHKTRILRDSEEYPSLLDTLPEFDLRMAQSGAVVIYYRARFCERLKEYAGIAHRECSGGREELGVEYQTVSTISDPLAPIETIYDQLRAHQASHAAAERASRMCLSGPHKDDIAVTIGGVNARQFSSQGQTRTAAISLKLAERELFRADTGEEPVLLLDDVLSELDAEKGARYINLSQALLSLGAVVSPFLVQWLQKSRHVSWRLPFLICAAAYTLLALLLLLTVFPKRQALTQKEAKARTNFFASRAFRLLFFSILLYVGLENGISYFAESLSRMFGKKQLPEDTQ